MVPEAGIEPAPLAGSDFESDASTNSTTRARAVMYLVAAKWIIIYIAAALSKKFCWQLTAFYTYHLF